MIWVWIVIGFVAVIVAFRAIARRGDEQNDFLGEQHGSGRNGTHPVLPNAPDAGRPGD